MEEKKEIEKNYKATKALHNSSITSGWSDDFDSSFI